MNDDAFMRLALELAKQAKEQQEVPIGAVLVLDNEVIGQGFNSPIANLDPTAHAEILALREASSVMQNYRLPGTTLYVTLEPCCMCYAAIINARVSRIVFGAKETKQSATSGIKLLHNKPFNHKVVVDDGVLEKECSSLIRDFFAEKRK